MTELAISVIVIILVVTEVVFLVLQMLGKKVIQEKTYRTQPKVLVMMSVRNEEKTIGNCIDSILSQNYGNFRFIVGDDDSEDSTLEIINSIDNEKLIVRSFKGEVQGKASVLHELSKMDKPDFYAVVDGDTIYTPDWLPEMVRLIGHNGIISGITGVKGNAFQDIEWITSLAKISTANSMGFVTTALGNNMIISADAYEVVGGFEAVKDSLTEDFAINKLIIEEGFGSDIILEPGTLAITEPVKGKTFFNQRKRWFTGVQKLSFNLKMLLFLYGLLLPLWIISWVFGYSILLKLLVIFTFLKLINELVIFLKIKKPLKLFTLLFFQVYQLFFSFFMLFIPLLPKKTEWKGRKR